MFFHRNAVILLLCLPLCCPARLVAQTTHGEETETIEPPATPESPHASKPDLEQVDALILQLTNEFRRTEGRHEVQSNAQLTDTARYIAEYMARTDKFGHFADENTPAGRARKHGYVYCLLNENIAYAFNSSGFPTKELAQEFVEGWKKSPGHRRNMLDPEVTETGVSVAHSSKTGYYYAVQMFGRPVSQRIEFRITNKADTAVEYRLGDRTYSLPPRYTRTHQQCRPSELTVQPPREGAKGTPGTSQTVKPADGSRYVIEQGPDGDLRVTSDQQGKADPNRN